MIPESLDRLASVLRTGELGIDTYLDELAARVSEREPNVLALEEEPDRFSRLRREAQALLEDYPDPAARPALFGIPVGVKDIFRVDGLPTRAGSELPAEEFEGVEARAVSRLKAAGALILGKTVSTEFAYFAPGATRNPVDPERTPGGSSSGSAAAVAAGLCPLALGTQTIGSISRPASFCGVVGYKPSYDRISRDGVIPLAPSLDHVGPFATTVAGAALAAQILCDEWHPCRASHRPALGVWEGQYLDSAEAEGRELFEGVCERLIDLGYPVRRVEVRAGFAAIQERHNALVAAEAAKVHEAWIERYRDRYHPKTIELIERGRQVSEAVVSLAQAGQRELRRELMVLKAEHRVDLWISPASRGVAPIGLETTGDPVMNLPWTHAGLPTVTIPVMSNADGLPFGLQIAAGWYQDERLLKWAGRIEADLG